MTEDKATPRPWKLLPITEEGCFRAPVIGDKALIGKDGVSPGIIWEYGAIGEANAELIVAAVNRYEAYKALEPAARKVSNAALEVLMNRQARKADNDFLQQIALLRNALRTLDEVSKGGSKE